MHPGSAHRPSTQLAARRAGRAGRTVLASASTLAPAGVASALLLLFPAPATSAAASAAASAASPPAAPALAAGGPLVAGGPPGSVIVIPSSPPPVPTTATIAPALAPDRLGARGALTFAIDYRGGVFGVPVPVRRFVLRLPRGLALDIPSLRACSAARLRARGPGGCPAQSQLGEGEALLEAHAGTENIPEQARLWAFLGPPQADLSPTVEILGQGYTPLDERVVFSGQVAPAQPPYGEQLSMSVPAVPTIMFEPDASVVRLRLTIGTRGARRRGGLQARVLVPRRCPRGGFPFAGEFSYADGSQSSSSAAVPCPRG